MSKLEAAEATLLALEKYGHAVDAANVLFRKEEYTGDPGRIEAAKKLLDEAIAAEKAAAIDPRDIARAAEAVLALKGEQHTEQGILPPNHGIATVKAERALADARRRELFENETGAIAKAEKDLADALAADAESKANHMTANAERAAAEHAGE